MSSGSCRPTKIPPQCKGKRKKCRKEKQECTEKPKEPPLLQAPHFIRTIGPKQIDILSKFIPSFVCYTTAALLFTIYACEWKTVLQYLPYYNGKYPAEPKEKPPPPPPPEDKPPEGEKKEC